MGVKGVKFITKINCDEPGFWQDIEDIITGLMMKDEKIRYLIIGDQKIDLVSR